MYWRPNQVPSVVYHLRVGTPLPRNSKTVRVNQVTSQLKQLKNQVKYKSVESSKSGDTDTQEHLRQCEKRYLQVEDALNLRVGICNEQEILHN